MKTSRRDELRRHTLPAQSGGFALIVALVLLLVMTMVAVIAMRSTTLDLKMATNTAVGRRAFQASESIRAMLSAMWGDAVRNEGWPASLGGSQADSKFPPGINTDLQVHAPSADPQSMPSNLADVEGARSTTPDISYSVDLNGDGVIGEEDLKADVWVTKIGTHPEHPGCNTCNPYPAFLFYELRSRGYSAGHAETQTSANFRALVNSRN